MEDIYCLVMFSISYQFSGVYYNLYVGIIFLNIYWEGIKILLPGNGTAIKNFIAGECCQYQALSLTELLQDSRRSIYLSPVLICLH